MSAPYLASRSYKAPVSRVIPERVTDAVYKLTSQTDQIRSYVYDTVRSTVPKLELDNVFISKSDIARDVKLQLSRSMAEFGFEIIQTLVTDIQPHRAVKDAMNEINASERLRLAAYEKAEAQKIAVVKAAEADAEAKFLAGQGIARQRQAIMSGLRESVQGFSSEVSEINSRQVMDMMLITQYFDMLREAGGASTGKTVFLPHQPGSIAEVANHIKQLLNTGLSAV